ncbi:MAG: hypothetical protein IKM72_01100 [Oscillospiraceae bacterium]|nr:hypothetical protein [Oscillospiraceae bacterium]
MKKTKQTMLTAAVLSAALAMQGELSYLSNSASAVTEPPVPADSDIRLMAAVYGPPPAKTTTEAEITEAPVTTAAITEIPIITDDPFIFIEPVSVMYGPVMVIEDPNQDGKVNIADYVILKDKLMQGKSSVPEWFEDINQDGEYDSEDLKILEHYFLDRELTSSEENSAQVTEPVSEDSNDD